MKWKRSATALLLAAALLLQGCSLLPFGLGDDLDLDLDLDFDFDPIKDVLSTTFATESSPTEPIDFERPYEPMLEPTTFDSIPYERPDTEALCDGFAAVQSAVEQGKTADEVLELYEDVYADYVVFNTMGSLAYIRYCLDLNDSFYDTEYNWCEAQSPLVEQAAEKCYIAMAKSPLRDELEAAYFEEGFFEYYDENEIYSNDRVVELMQQESELQTQYMALQNEQTISWQGEEVYVSELLDDPDLDYAAYLQVLELYYQKYNTAAAELFIQLIGVRQEIARELDYDSYADFAYAYYYDRDYTPEQTEAYLSDIARYLAPLSDLTYGTYSAEMDTQEVMQRLDTVTKNLGGELRLAYEHMLQYELYDIRASESKMSGSFTTYLDAYELPYVYISPTGTSDDMLTACHEFGHYADAYVNCGQTSSIDCAEIFSQALEFLALDNADLDFLQRYGMTRGKLADALSVFLSQACYADFECRVYAMPPEELTVETLNALFLESCRRFEYVTEGLEAYIAPSWTDVQHFFIAPYYVISYCVSNDAALQVYQRELSDGGGLELYQTLLHHAADNTILALLDEAGMKSPFADGRVRELAVFFEEELD